MGNICEDRYMAADCTIAPEILSSWKRCRDIGLNPYDDSI